MCAAQGPANTVNVTAIGCCMHNISYNVPQGCTCLRCRVCLQVAQLMSAALGPVNSFTVTIDAGPQYSSVACSGASCNLDITYFAKVYASLPSASGYFLKTVVKCACGPGYQSMTPAANSTSGNNNTSPTGSASLTCNPCGAGWYRWAVKYSSSVDDHMTAPCGAGWYTCAPGRAAVTATITFQPS